MAYVRGHPGDFDAWAQAGAAGWSDREVLPNFKKSEGFTPSDDIAIDAQAHNCAGPLGVSVRSPVLPGAREFVEAAVAAGIPRGDYNARDRGGPRGVVSLFQTTTRSGKRSSTYHAFLEGEAEQRPNLSIVTGAHVTRVIVEGAAGHKHATGVEYRIGSDDVRTAHAAKEVVLSGGAIGSPHLLLLSGIGPRAELEAAGIACQADSPHVPASTGTTKAPPPATRCSKTSRCTARSRSTTSRPRAASATSSILASRSRGSASCALPTPASCRMWSVATPTQRRS